MAKPVFQGSIVALVTPFRDGKVDEATLRSLVEFQIAGGTNGIVPCGTTRFPPLIASFAIVSLPLSQSPSTRLLIGASAAPPGRG